jgi:hypothetical protein
MTIWLSRKRCFMIYNRGSEKSLPLYFNDGKQKTRIHKASRISQESSREYYHPDVLF